MKLIREEISLDDFAKLDKEVKRLWKALITVEKYEEHLSENQRKYYFSVIVNWVAEYHWFWKEEAHIELKTEYLPDYEDFLKEMEWLEVTKMMQKFLEIYHDLTITNQKVWEFEAYLSRIRAWEAKKGLYLPLPNETNTWDTAYLVK